MTFRHFEIYAEVCRQESITKAANALNIAQPSVSLAVRELEEYYGTKLFERMNRRLYLTDSGRKLREYADSILSQCDEVKDLLRDNSDIVTIRLGANVSFGNGLLAPFLKDFKKGTPGIDINVSINNSKQIEEMLLQNRLDAAIMDLPNQLESLQHKHLYSENIIALCSRDYMLPNIISTDTILQEPLLIREKGNGIRNSLELYAATHQINLQIACESISDLSLLQACSYGQGILLLSETAFNRIQNIPDLRKINLLEGNLPFSRDYYLVHHKKKFIGRGMDQFMEFAANYHYHPNKKYVKQTAHPVK